MSQRQAAALAEENRIRDEHQAAITARRAAADTTGHAETNGYRGPSVESESDEYDLAEESAVVPVVLSVIGSNSQQPSGHRAPPAPPAPPASPTPPPAYVPSAPPLELPIVSVPTPTHNPAQAAQQSTTSPSAPIISPVPPIAPPTVGGATLAPQHSLLFTPNDWSSNGSRIAMPPNRSPDLMSLDGLSIDGSWNTHPAVADVRLAIRDEPVRAPFKRALRTRGNSFLLS
ncbi:uncharacterized protein LY89DRAFT_783410 [Mollisia scopiformis]|uniref:Uncharacterized protein n=1 Tax=Mollisia scopiformis TaxID=149040 RepID=A0A194X4W2_MOLSC|nr:uncharacterized protein LY89DRAFT_783410 [Mollisia scopiformis]KUJ15216.1 hypothetical protein LY89DRAFT_783410 [Mollisia scopiformis]